MNFFWQKNRFQEGLKFGGLYENIAENADNWKHLFVGKGKLQLTAARLTCLFKPNLSPMGSNKRRNESLVLTFWRDWLIEVEGITCTCFTL